MAMVGFRLRRKRRRWRGYLEYRNRSKLSTTTFPKILKLRMSPTSLSLLEAIIPSWLNDA
jgi:hypothetical protein